jgi:hypothetical protein
LDVVYERDLHISFRTTTRNPPDCLAVVGRVMATYESDSSGGEEDYTETNVLLGYAAKEPTEDTISHLGGRPV